MGVVSWGPLGIVEPLVLPAPAEVCCSFVCTGVPNVIPSVMLSDVGSLLPGFKPGLVLIDDSCDCPSDVLLDESVGPSAGFVSAHLYSPVLGPDPKQ